MKVEKVKFDSLLTKLLKAKLEPRKKIKARGKHGSKKAIISYADGTPKDQRT